jgi:hypothetical protein
VALGSSDGSPAAPVQAGCGRPLPPVSRDVPLDADLQVRDDLSPGGRGRGTVVLVNRGRRAVVVLTTQAVLLTPAGRLPVSPPESPVPAGRLLEPGEFLRQDLTLLVQPCSGEILEPGFYEVALVVVLAPVRGGRATATTTSRRAVVVRPRPG